MSIRAIPQVLVVAFGISVSSGALARNPPALVAEQQAAAHATQTSGGYRDMNRRFGSVAERTPSVMTASGGYRDIHSRFQNVAPAHETASNLR